LLAEQVEFSASLAFSEHETSQTLCTVSVPTTHYLEAWGDAINFDGTYSIQQPIIAPLNQGSMSIQDFLILTANFINASSFADTPTFYDFIRKNQSDFASKSTWEQLLRDGVHSRTTSYEAGTASGLSSLPNSPTISGGLTIAITPSYALLDGSQANNSWLQELPDPITKATWGNVAMMNKQTAQSLNAVQGEVLRFSTTQGSIELPVFIQPGMSNNVVSIALGYGRTAGGKVLEGVGANAYTLLSANGGLYVSAKVEKVGRTEKIATTQGHHAIERYDKPSPFDNEWKERTKDILGVEEGYITLASLAAAKGGSHEEHGHDAHHISDTLSIVDGFHYNGHRWAMAIDLSACTGCSACVVACQAENNIPTVGKKFVANSREMHWIRIDRYYREDASGNVTTVFQPMLCQHCENAPCENVCPVAATTHSPEGLNEMTYNRCVGTRYCLNNCPYKVRRFNFLNWHKDKKTPLDMAFNPDVTVRMRGVMEKCTFCVQRLNEAKMHAKDQGHSRVQDGEVVTACQQACPAGAILFGNVNDPKSAVAKAATINRGNHTQEYKEKNGAYKVLSELNVRPSVTYLVKVRNTE
jgi:molybdopterin-containing oxidoreductase family iron-sulfur binding subunit